MTDPLDPPRVARNQELWGPNGPRGGQLTQILLRRMKNQIRSVLSDDDLTADLQSVARLGKREAESNVEAILDERFGNRLMYGTVRAIAEHYQDFTKGA